MYHLGLWEDTNDDSDSDFATVLSLDETDTTLLLSIEDYLAEYLTNLISAMKDVETEVDWGSVSVDDTEGCCELKIKTASKITSKYLNIYIQPVTGALKT